MHEASGRRLPPAGRDGRDRRLRDVTPPRAGPRGPPDARPPPGGIRQGVGPAVADVRGTRP